MPFRTLAVAAAAGVLLVALLYLFLFPSLDAESRLWFHGSARVALLLLVAIAAAMAAHQFNWWGEYFGRAWTLFFVEYALLAIGEILSRGFPDAAFADEICIVVANLAGIGAYLLMARALRTAGLQSDDSPAKRLVVTLLALAMAIALCYPSVLSSLASVRTNPGLLVSPIADIITFVLVAPLLLTTMLLRGGQLFWAFAFLTTGTIGWMVNQGAGTVVTLLGGGDVAVRTGRMTGFAIACFFIAAAALTQYLSVRRATRKPVHHA